MAVLRGNRAHLQCPIDRRTKGWLIGHCSYDKAQLLNSRYDERLRLVAADSQVLTPAVVAVELALQKPGCLRRALPARERSRNEQTLGLRARALASR
jgi:hypothetical protein